MSWKDILKYYDPNLGMTISDAYDITGNETASELWMKHNVIPMDTKHPHDDMGCQLWSPDGQQYYCLVHNVRVKNPKEN